jgi:hypothetical protein
MEAQIQPKRYIVLQARDPQCFNNRKQTYKVCSACGGSAVYEVSGKSLQWKPKYSQKGIFDLNLSLGKIPTE